MKFAARHFYLASLSLSLVPFSQSPSLGERPIPLEDPLSRRNLGHTRAREERKTERRFRTILERSSISYERCRSPLAYKTFIKSRRNELAAGADDAHGRRGRQAAAGCQMILKLFGTVSTNPSSTNPCPCWKVFGRRWRGLAKSYRVICLLRRTTSGRRGRKRAKRRRGSWTLTKMVANREDCR